MEEARITLTIKPVYIERLLYWIAIIVLAVLLLLSYLDDGSGPDTEQEEQPAPVASPPADQEEVQASAGATCSDGLLNQDESDVDCGGSCPGCSAGGACISASDCDSNSCVSGKCVREPAPQQLSGELKITIADVSYDKSPSDTVKITGIDYKIENGLSQSFDGFLMKVFVKNKAGTRCLNQQQSGTCNDSYAEIVLPSVQSGKTTEDGATFTDSHYTTKMGRFLIEDNGYSPGDPSDDDFSVFVYLYDTTGNMIGGKTYSSFRTMNPT